MSSHLGDMQQEEILSWVKLYLFVYILQNIKHTTEIPNGVHMPLKGLTRINALDDKRFTTTLYGNGPGHIINGSRPDVNASVAGTCCQIMMEEFLSDIPF